MRGKRAACRDPNPNPNPDPNPSQVRGERAADLTKYTAPQPCGEAAIAAAAGDAAALTALPLAALEAADASGNTPFI